MAPLIESMKLPNDMPPDELIIRSGPESRSIGVDPARAGWRYLSCSVVAIPDGETLTVGRLDVETALVIIRGGGLRVAWEGAEATALRGRRTVWDGLPWGLYLPPGRVATVTADPVVAGESVVVAMGQAPPGGQEGVASEPVVLAPDDGQVELRGAGQATRQVTHIIKPGFPADRLLCVEVYTPGGNWSGWPSHKHDVDDFPHEAVLEETYFYQVRRPEGWGIQRLYRKDGTRDAMWAVRDGDLVFMPDGYHPFAAPPLYDCYYLNFLAGDRRTMANREDPDLAWVRGTFEETAVDARLPFVTAQDPAVAGGQPVAVRE
jgi:5-deoxy-glucuronate isomerase